VSLYLGPAAYKQALLEHRRKTNDGSPLAVHETGMINAADEVVALARWVATAAGQAPVNLYTSLPFHVLPSVAALLKHQVGHVTFQEWDKDAETYRACPMPGGSRA
jgi:hypothetical protein